MPLNNTARAKIAFLEMTIFSIVRRAGKLTWGVRHNYRYVEIKQN